MLMSTAALSIGATSANAIDSDGTDAIDPDGTDAIEPEGPNAVKDPGGGGTCGKPCWAHHVVLRGRPMMEFYNKVGDTRHNFDMDTDGCSAPWWTGQQIWEIVFHRACKIHDFGYHNFGPGELHINEYYLAFGQWDWTANTDKEWIDQRFRQTMNWICDENPSDTCYDKANQFYQAVRFGGNGAWDNN